MEQESLLRNFHIKAGTVGTKQTFEKTGTMARRSGSIESIQNIY